MNPYPGTVHHQALLEYIVRYYADDERILAVCLFGSLARGNWDQYSDLDLDVVVKDGVQISVIDELQNLCKAFDPLGESALLIIPNGDDAGDIVLSSLTEISIRYHTLAMTSPNIIDNLQLLTGKIDIETVKAAGFVNRTARHSTSDYDVDRILRWALEVIICLRREQFWQAVRLLQFMREGMIEIFATSRSYPRAYHAFESHADETLEAKLIQTFPRSDLESVREALLVILTVLENNIDNLSNGQLHLTMAQRQLVITIRSKVATP